MSDNIVPVSQDLERLLDGLDENLEPIAKEKEDDQSEADAEKDTTTDKEAEQADEADKPVEDDAEGEVSDKEDEAEADDTEGYTIDQDDTEAEQDEATPTNSTDENKTNPSLTPEDAYILENLQPITVRGQVADKDVEVKVYAPEQLPQGFKFNDDRDREIVGKAFNMLESRAQQLQTDYRSQQTAKSATEFKAAEDAADRSEIGELQRDGVIPKFKAEPNSKDFDSDPAVKLVQEVLDFKEKENERFLKEFNAGKPYKHIGFEEAFFKYQRTNPPKVDEEQKKEDAERKEVARRTSKTSTTGGGKSGEPKEIFHSSRDLNNYIDNLGWD